MPELKERILSLRQTFRHLSAMLFYEKLIAEAVVTPDKVSYHTVYRLLRYHDLLTKDVPSAAERKRFAYDKVNVLWQGDLFVGSYLTVGGRKLKTNLFAFLDDCSRIIPSARFSFSEKFDALKQVLKEGLLRRGIPRMIYVDNGKIFTIYLFPRGLPEVDLFVKIQTAILTLFQNKRITPVLILDELHMASNGFLNDISLLFNFVMDSENPFVLILAGLPHLSDRLKLSHNQPLAQRIVLRHHVQPLAIEDVQRYLDHHLKRAGAGYEIFTPQAVETIAAAHAACPGLLTIWRPIRCFMDLVNSFEQLMRKLCSPLRQRQALKHKYPAYAVRGEQGIYISSTPIDSVMQNVLPICKRLD